MLDIYTTMGLEMSYLQLQITIYISIPYWPNDGPLSPS